MLDTKDSQIISLLMKNSRMSLTAISEELAISRANIQQRLSRMIDQGVIERFTLKLGKKTTKSRLRAAIFVKLSKGNSTKFEKQLSIIEACEGIWTINGEFDYLLFVEVDSAEELDELLLIIRKRDDVFSTDCRIRLDQKK